MISIYIGFVFTWEAYIRLTGQLLLWRYRVDLLLGNILFKVGLKNRIIYVLCLFLYLLTVLADLFYGL